MSAISSTGPGDAAQQLFNWLLVIGLAAWLVHRFVRLGRAAINHLKRPTAARLTITLVVDNDKPDQN